MADRLGMLAAMKRLVWITLALVACGKNNAKEDGPPATEDTLADSSVDAPAIGPCANPVNGTTITAREVGNIGNSGAMLVTAPAGDPKLYVVGQAGEIRIIDENETLLPTPFLDLSGVISVSEEGGLLGLAFHPQYHVNREFFVYYTKNQGGLAGFPLRDVVARCKGDPTNPNKAEPTCAEILSIRDPLSNHNGGMIEFGADGFLYIGTGDGGPQNDPGQSAQALVDGVVDPQVTIPPEATALLGKMLRIDVDHPANGKDYGIPSDNPFAAGGGAPEIFMIGFRNPWRWSFDRGTGDMWIGDVGQGAIEEIHYVKAGTGAGKNFGWRMYEGSSCAHGPCDPANKVFPVDERTHNNGFTAIIGGQVYRGTCYPDVVGTYFYSDNGKGRLFTAKLNPDGTTVTKADLTGVTLPGAGQPASIHASANGELYIGTTSGRVLHIEASP